MIGLDVNLLVEAARNEARYHREALAALEGLSAGTRPWVLLWPVVYGFVRIVTHPTALRYPMKLGDALESIESLMDSPSVVLAGEGPAHRSHFARTLRAFKATGNLVSDAHLAALAVEHGVTEWWTLDEDFRRFTGLKVRNPFAAPTRGPR